jgi:hypothetical protein
MNSLITQSKQMPAICLTVALLVLGLLTACEPSKERKAQWAEEKRVACLDKFCEGDIEPPRDLIKEAALKLNGQWYFGPKEYFSSGKNGGGFYWPSRLPMFTAGDTSSIKGIDFSDIAIEIFFRSNNIPARKRSDEVMAQWQAQGRIYDRKTIRKGLDSMRVRNEDGTEPRGTIYVATELKGLDGLPPMAGCYHSHPNDGGSAGFMWQDGIFAGIRMNQKHCADWPEIYQEIARVLTLLKKV